MICPNCKSENAEGAKFCKKCGAPLKKTISHEKMINSMSGDKSDNTTKIIIAALIIIAVVLAGAFIYLQTSGNSASTQHSSDAQNAASSISNNNAADSSQPAQATQSSSSSKPAQSSSNMKILGGTFSTGSELEDKTYAHINVGRENAGKSVIVQIWYSRDGNTLNHGNMVPVTVDSSGYLDVSSADAYAYYPDFAEINLFDSNSKLLDTQSVSLSPSSGTQSF